MLFSLISGWLVRKKWALKAKIWRLFGYPSLAHNDMISFQVWVNKILIVSLLSSVFIIADTLKIADVFLALI